MTDRPHGNHVERSTIARIPHERETDVDPQARRETTGTHERGRGYPGQFAEEVEPVVSCGWFSLRHYPARRMSTQPVPPEDVRRYRALSSEVRRRLLDSLRAEGGVAAGRLAEQLDLHVNTVRSHLNVLEEAGLVASVAEDRDRPGRPKLLYRATRAATEVGRGAESGGYRLLAQVLAGYLGAMVEDVAGAAELAGAAWGHHLVDKPAPFQAVAPEEAVQRLVELMREFGFEPELVTDDPSASRLELGRCPFLEVAREHQDVVCSVHLGLMRGALDELGAEVRAVDLIPWAKPHVCVANLDVPATP